MNGMKGYVGPEEDDKEHVMGRSIWILALITLSGTRISRADGIEVRSTSFAARMEHGSLVELTASDAARYVTPPAEPQGASVHLSDGDHWATSEDSPGALAVGESTSRTYERFSDLKDARAEVHYAIDSATGDLVIRQQASTADTGVWGVGWWIADIPLDYAVLVPGGSGLRLTRDTPGSSFQYDYPMSWEVQLVVVEGPRGGFCVWAEDPAGRFKRLVVERRPTGWRLGLVTINDAPFDKLTACDSVTWRLNAYEGDWRAAARRYRDWFQQQSHPVAVAEQQPAWVKDIRACVIMGLNTNILNAMPDRFDPPQTLLYLPDWRQAGYDRNYPDYEQIRPQLRPFIERSHELGFRVMLHVNYFGVDPLHPLYRQFEPYQVRSPWGNHDKQWWVWPPEEPDIRFAYINPACEAWRDLFTDLMVRLCEQTQADALHLDQTLCIFNDHNGRIDGMSMLDGNIALHRQLREALPDVALSGEGLNEVTCRYESFAQRHVPGMDHTKGTYDRRWLAAAHPISSYILRPFTTMYGYLGCASPENDQLYAAWQEAYRHWGVIPTWKPSQQALADPTGFSRQFFDELRVWQQQRVEIDLDRAWPDEVAFPLRTAEGRPFLSTSDRRWVCGAGVISRTITGTGRVEGTGTIPDWPAYDAEQIFGLDPAHWYPYFATPRTADQFHVCQMPDGVMIDYVAVSNQLALLSTRDATPLVADLTMMLDQAACGTRPDRGSPRERVGPWDSPDGAAFSSFGDTLSAHPPWKNSGSGEAFARFSLAVPDESKVFFVSDVFMDSGSVGQPNSDGVTFIVRASDGSQKVSQQIHQATAEPSRLELDLTQFHGEKIELELAADPGPTRSPSFDWARWRRPRVERVLRRQQTIGVCGGRPWSLALTANGMVTLGRQAATQTVDLEVPGAVVFLRQRPADVALPVDLAKSPDQTFFILDSGNVVSSSLYASVAPGGGQVGGVQRSGLFVHPPDNGRTVAVYAMTLPTTPARFRSHIGLRDGSTSDGAALSLEVNGRQQARELIKPGKWELLEADLSPWAGQPIVLSLVTDSAGSFQCDWTVWGEPQICAR